MKYLVTLVVDVQPQNPKYPNDSRKDLEKWCEIKQMQTMQLNNSVISIFHTKTEQI